MDVTKVIQLVHGGQNVEERVHTDEHVAVTLSQAPPVEVSGHQQEEDG